MARYVSKPRHIEAVLWTGDNLEEIKELAGRWYSCYWPDTGSVRLGYEGRWLIVSKGSYLVKSVEGEIVTFSAMSEKVFESRYSLDHLCGPECYSSTPDTSTAPAYGMAEEPT
jgi:hypothetical protein